MTTFNRIYYTEKTKDDDYEYRFVILPKDLIQKLPQQRVVVQSSDGQYRHETEPRLMSEPEWRSIGVQQSRGWEHYHIHKPEPHVLLFRRSLDFTQT